MSEGGHDTRTLEEAALYTDNSDLANRPATGSLKKEIRQKVKWVDYINVLHVTFSSLCRVVTQVI